MLRVARNRDGRKLLGVTLALRLIFTGHASPQILLPPAPIPTYREVNRREVDTLKGMHGGDEEEECDHAATARPAPLLLML